MLEPREGVETFIKIGKHGVISQDTLVLSLGRTLESPKELWKNTMTNDIGHFCRSKRVEYKEFHMAYSNKFPSDFVFRCVSYSIITAQLFIQKV